MARKTIPVTVTAVVGLMMFVDYFLNIPAINDWAATLRAWGVIVSTFALGVGAANLVVVHGRRVTDGSKKSWLSAVLLAGLIITACLTIFTGPKGKGTVFVFDGIIQSVTQALYSMLGLCICSAAYRAFRAHNIESSIMLVVGTLVLVAQIPTAQAVAPWLVKPSAWIMSTVNVAGQRGIMVSSGIAFIGLSLRVILGIDKSHLGSE